MESETPQDLEPPVAADDEALEQPDVPAGDEESEDEDDDDA